jgi:hypothetical protein
MDQEALEILGMVKEGKITPEQGAELLEAMKRPAAVSGGKPRFVRIKVDVQEPEADTVAVNLNVPIALADLALKLAEGAKFQRGDQTIMVGEYLKSLSGMDLASILQLVKEGAQGKLVDVDVAEKDGKKVKVEIVVD